MFGRRSTSKQRRLALLAATLGGLLAHPVFGAIPIPTVRSLSMSLAWTETGRIRIVDENDEAVDEPQIQLPELSPAPVPPLEPSEVIPGRSTLPVVRPRAISVSNAGTTVVVAPPKLPERQSSSATMSVTIVAPEPPPVPELPAADTESAVDASEEASILPKLAADEDQDQSGAPAFPEAALTQDTPSSDAGTVDSTFDFASTAEKEWPLPPGSEEESTPATGASDSLTEPVQLAPSTPAMIGPIAFFDDGTPSVPTPADPSALPPSPEPSPSSGSTSEEQISDPDDVLNRDETAGSQTADNEEQKLGEAPEDTTLRFLRQQTVLLDPCEFQFDVGFQYLNDEIDFPGLNIDNNNNVIVGELTRRQRLLMMPLEMRVGLTKWSQGFIRVPFGWSNSETSFNGDAQHEDSGILGDISAGITKQIIVGNEFYPDVLFTAAFSAPTGDSSFVTSLITPGAALGQGFWTATANLTFIQNYDPLVIFYGLGYTHRFEEKFGDDIYVDPGQIFSYRFGVGFAVNPHVTLSSTFFGSYIGKNEVNDVEIGGSAQEPMQLRLAATISRRKQSDTHSSVKIIEPFVNFGLNEDAIDALFGITFTH